MGNERFRGKLTKQQLDITIRLHRIKSRRVKDYLYMYYVNGIIITDIVAFTGCDSGNVHRDITKIAKILNFVELFNEYEELK